MPRNIDLAAKKVRLAHASWTKKIEVMKEWYGKILDVDN